MSIKVGTRLEQLLKLQTRIEQEIQVERLRLACDDRRPEDRHDFRSAPVEERPIEPAVVRAWGLAHGLTTSTSGRISLELMTAYREAHAMELE